MKTVSDSVTQYQSKNEILFTPQNIGKVTLRNRILLSAMTTGFGFTDGAPDTAFVDYLTQVGKDVGLATVAFGAVAVEGRVENQVPWLWREDIAEHLLPVSEGLKSVGAIPCIQLGHGGRQVSEIVTKLQPVAPSAIAPEAHVQTVPHELGLDEIYELVDAFGIAAKRAQEGGFEAVEIHAGHGYLIQQFLSPESNQRADEFGGSNAYERANFGAKVIAAIQRHAPGMTIIARVNGDDKIPGGIHGAEAVEAARRFVEAGADALLVSGGVYGSVPWTIPVLDDAEPAFLDSAAYIRAAVDVPVIAVGGFRTPSMAARAIHEGSCDAVALGRSLLADPDWVRKAKESKPGSIRPCIATLQGCAGQLQNGGQISCQVNPDIGRPVGNEAALAVSARIAVVGGGPAGLEAARRAAELGHYVTLFEASNNLGGLARLAGKTSPLRHFESLVGWYERELDALNVEIQLNSPVTSAVQLSNSPEYVLVATGSEVKIPMIEGYDELPVWLSTDVLLGEESSTGEVHLPGEILVVGAGTEAVAIAIWLAETGRDIVMLTKKRLVEDNSGVVRRALKSRLERLGVSVVSGKLARLAQEGAYVETDGSRQMLIPASGIILSGDRQSLVPTLNIEASEKIGDAKSPRGISDAIEEGRTVAERVGLLASERT